MSLVGVRCLASKHLIRFKAFKKLTRFYGKATKKWENNFYISYCWAALSFVCKDLSWAHRTLPLKMASSSLNDFTVYHMKCINFFRWTCLARSVIRLDPSGRYIIKRSPIICQVWFFVYFLNTLTKLVFLCFLITGHLGPTEFLDTICGIDYLLCGCMVCIAYYIWRRYPIYGMKKV